MAVATVEVGDSPKQNTGLRKDTCSAAGNSASLDRLACSIKPGLSSKFVRECCESGMLAGLATRTDWERHRHCL